jgi:hypothetical protein
MCYYFGKTKCAARDRYAFLETENSGKGQDREEKTDRNHEMQTSPASFITDQQNQSAA